MADPQQPPAEETAPSAPPRTEPPERPGDDPVLDAKDPLRRSKTGALWISTIALGVVLILLVVLILQNTQQVKFSFLWWEGTPPLAAALLIAAAGGILVTAIAGSLRILQLRRRVRRR